VNRGPDELSVAELVRFTEIGCEGSVRSRQANQRTSCRLIDVSCLLTAVAMATGCCGECGCGRCVSCTVLLVGTCCCRCRPCPTNPPPTAGVRMIKIPVRYLSGIAIMPLDCIVFVLYSNTSRIKHFALIRITDRTQTTA